MRYVRLLILLIVLPFNTYATDYWVDDNGAAAWVDCSGAAKSGANACSVATANANADAGDTVYLRTGTYDTTYINPTNSGSSGNRIIFEAYNDEVVTFTGMNYGALLTDKSYITIDGIRIVDIDISFISIGNSTKQNNYNIIQNCYMDSFADRNAWAGINNVKSAYNQILNNTIIGTCPCESRCDATYGGPHDGIYIRESQYTLVQGNTVTYCQHYGIVLRENSRYSVIKDNTVASKWHGSITVVAMGTGKDEVQNLIENNLVYDAGEEYLTNYCSDSAIDWPRYRHAGFQIGAPENIFRNNILANNGRTTPETWSSINWYSQHNRFYNNTYYGNYRAVWVESSGSAIDTILKNNIFHDSVEYDIRHNTGSANDYTYVSNHFTGEIVHAYKNVAPYWIDNTEDTDPLFTDQANKDFTLTANSTMINAGGWLTTTNGTGSSSTTLIVDDAMYFCDGFGIVTGDTIQLEGQTATATITDINYSTNTLTLDTALTWADEIGVALPYYGTAPDKGAEEFLGETAEISGTVVSGGVLEAEIKAGGETLVIDLPNNEWVATVGADNQITTDLIAGIVAGTSQTNGWNNEVLAVLTHAHVVRTDANTVTITLPVVAAYAILDNETCTITIPASATNSDNAIVGVPTFEITADSDPAITLTGTMLPNADESDIVTGGLTMIFTAVNAEFVATLGADNQITTDFLLGITSAQSEAAGWNATVRDVALTYAHVTRDNATQATVTFPAVAGYDISANEEITSTIPATSLTTAGAVEATPTVGVVHFDTATEETKGVSFE